MSTDVSILDSFIFKGKKDKPSQSDNLKFYKNELKSYPDGKFRLRCNKN
jgi:hypothetical protein